MSYDFSEPVDEYGFERSEAAWARHTGPPAACRPTDHHWATDGHGGGVCTNCGDTASAGEL